MIKKKKKRLIGTNKSFYWQLDSINLNHSLCTNVRFDVSFGKKCSDVLPMHDMNDSDSADVLDEERNAFDAFMDQTPSIHV